MPLFNLLILAVFSVTIQEDICSRYQSLQLLRGLQDPVAPYSFLLGTWGAFKNK